jgi:DNA end-binding protein Ku
MEQLHYADELKQFDEVPLGEAEVKEAELALAAQLSEQAKTDTFDPSKYHDDVRERMMELIQKKIDGEDITQITSEEPKGQIIDLMEALKASLAKETSGESRKATKAAPPTVEEEKARKVGG